MKNKRPKLSALQVSIGFRAHGYPNTCMRAQTYTFLTLRSLHDLTLLFEKRVSLLLMRNDATGVRL